MTARNSAPDPTVSLNLTVSQRRLVAALLPSFNDRLKLNESNSRTIKFSTDEVDTIRSRIDSAISFFRGGTKQSSLRHILTAIEKATGTTASKVSQPEAAVVYQFKITLVDSEPPIWRRIRVKDCTLDSFHGHIQAAMGWQNCHLHQFDIEGRLYGDPELLQDGFSEFDCVDSTDIYLSELLPTARRKFRFKYEYDFGDGWLHEIVFEGCLEPAKDVRYPLCFAGKRACPPEDVGGVWGYVNVLEAVRDRSHEQHREYKQWLGRFDPECFDPEKATKAMQRGLPDWRQL